MDKLITLEEGEVLENWDYFKEFKEKFPDVVLLMEQYREIVYKHPGEESKLAKETLIQFERSYENWRLTQPVKFIIKNIKGLGRVKEVDEYFSAIYVNGELYLKVEDDNESI